MKQSAFLRMAAVALGTLACISMIYISGKNMAGQWRFTTQETVQKCTEEMYMPGLAYLKKDSEPTAIQWIKKTALSWLPLVRYVEQKEPYELAIEDEETIAKILENQANDENMIDENGNLIAKNPPVEEIPPAPPGSSPIDMSIEKLRDFNYLLGNFYTVDSTTMIGPEQLNVDDLLGRSMKVDTTGEEPKVLIFHTHSQEAFADSVPGDPNTSIVGVGEYLTQLLNQKGIKTIHDTGVYDIINGQLDRSNAYENAEASIRQVLDANPSVEVVIDLHRDGVAEGTHLLTEVNGKPTARIMYFNGLSRTRTNGDIAYLNNPYIQDNLAFSLQMELASESRHPGFARHIYLGGYRYNLHLKPKSLLIEAGAQTNTVEEMKNAMEVLADTLHYVLTE
ncbi:MAG: stage II sporulation protein P [Muricomes sp.]